MKDVGVKKKRKVIADIIFDEDAENPKLVNSMLKQFGISNPARRIIVRRWSQRIGEEPPEISSDQSGEREKSKGDLGTPSELLKWKLMGELFGESEEEESFLEERLRSIEDVLMELQRSRDRGFQREEPAQPPVEEPEYTAEPCGRHSDCLICGRCGGHINVRDFSPSEFLVCPYCGLEYGPEK